MTVTLDLQAITDIFRAVHQENRSFLYEHEVYALLALAGAETTPKYVFIPKNSRMAEEEIMALPGEKAVLKIVSPTIVHKTEAGGVRIVPKTPEHVRSGVRRMLSEVPEKYAQWIEQHPSSAPAAYRGLEGDALHDAIAGDIQGVLQVQYMPPESNSFGNELIVGLRRTREFGMVISAGLGGTDTELFAANFRKGRAIALALTGMLDGRAFFELFRKTLAYRKLSGRTRGQGRVITDDQLIECFDSFIRLANHFSRINPEAEFCIDEMEINPFTFNDYRMVPLDGMCKFSMPDAVTAGRPTERIHNLLHPKTIGIVGASATRRNFGRIILENILDAGYDKNNVYVIRKDAERDEATGARCVPDLRALKEPLDLFVVAVPASGVPALAEEIIDTGKARGVLLISGGLGETDDSKEMARRMMDRISAAHATGDGGPVFLGANSMGVISRPGRYDTWFTPKTKLHDYLGMPALRTALVSQSGAFLFNRFNQAPEMSPKYLISMGNQTDLTLGDMMRYFKTSSEVDVIAVYAEGFKERDGLHFAEAVREATRNGKQVVFYKAGRTPEGKNATSGHTASVAGDFTVCESCVRQAGGIIAQRFADFQELTMVAEAFSGMTIGGRRMGLVSGAGFETVGMADSLASDDYAMTLASFTEETRKAIYDLLVAKKLDKLVPVHNPLDINPGADDEAHAGIAELVLNDPGVDAVILGLDPHSPATHTLAGSTDDAIRLDHPDGILARLTALRKRINKPLVCVVDSGEMYEPLRKGLRAAGIPTFSVCDRAMSVLGTYMEARLNAARN